MKKTKKPWTAHILTLFPEMFPGPLSFSIIGKALKEIVLHRKERLPHFQKLLTPLRTTLKKQEFIAGETPGFSDYIVFGAFQWARCISDFSLLKADDSICLWRKKMLDLHHGLAMNSVGYPV